MKIWGVQVGVDITKTIYDWRLHSALFVLVHCRPVIVTLLDLSHIKIHVQI